MAVCDMGRSWGFFLRYIIVVTEQKFEKPLKNFNGLNTLNFEHELKKTDALCYSVSSDKRCNLYCAQITGL